MYTEQELWSQEVKQHFCAQSKLTKRRVDFFFEVDPRQEMQSVLLLSPEQTQQLFSAFVDQFYSVCIEQEGAD